MDIVTDLTAEAVSYITLFQDILKNEPKINLPNKSVKKNDWLHQNVNDTLVSNLTIHQKEKLIDLIWHSPTRDDISGLVQKYFDRMLPLLDWISDSIPPDKNSSQSLSETIKLILSQPPFYWRQEIRNVLYEQSEKRVELVEILQYMPLQVILAITGKGNLDYTIRLYQFYEKTLKEKPETKRTYIDYDLLGFTDRRDNYLFWAIWRPKAKEYLQYDQKLLNELKNKEFPLPFETFFREELIEISKARKNREKQFSNVFDDDSKKEKSSSYSFEDQDLFDPLGKAGEMKLRGIALSGGGIRSATFNLGILQRLANLNELHKFDYISTVSGGGYIGSWFNSWIHRSGSFKKINDRLCPNKSGDPLADEVRPIRWLRMFSNYLSPNVGIMSADAWASGMTWLRNALINQLVLLLSLLTILFFISDIYHAWTSIKDRMSEQKPSDTHIFIWSFIIFLILSLLITTAMQSFYDINKKKSDKRFKKLDKFIKWFKSIFDLPNSLPNIIVIWGGIGALLISTYFAACQPPFDQWEKFLLARAVFVSAFLTFCWVALRGNYHKRWDLMEIGKKNVATQIDSKEKDLSGQIVFAIIGSTLVSSAVLAFLLMLFWSNVCDIYIFFEDLFKSTAPIEGCDIKACDIKMFDIKMFDIKMFDTETFANKMFLVIGIPIILEIFSIAVILRMVLMGNLFPDYRREWWGRIGGLIHRFMLLWTIVSFVSLIMPDLWKYLWENLWKFHSKKLLALGGGWAGIIGWGLKKAFESKDETQAKAKSYVTTLVKVIPFVFMIGLLLIGSRIKEIIIEYDFFSSKGNAWKNIFVTLILAAITLLLSWRVGVNEFSLHHFYRNRLVRAFLGATRSREDRIKSANGFTGFDANDDILLSSMRVENGYAGPFPLINSTLNTTVVNALDRQDRMGESFVFSPLYCGYDFSPTRASTYNIDHVYEYGYRPTAQFSNENGGPTLGTAMAISGAAVNPNWGYHSSATMAFLLTLFNLRLGWWMGNPRLDEWKRPDPKFGLLYLMRDLIGKSDINMKYVCLSDGGHFDNMGLYELVRRRCDYILIGDGEQDQETTCEGLANAIRRCRIDFGVEIKFDDETDTSKKSNKTENTDGIDEISEIEKIKKKKVHIIKGTITYPGNVKHVGTLIYIKAVVVGDEPVDVREYALANVDFPHQSTGDQFFDESQFESYRKLGYNSIDKVSQLYIPKTKK
jgi:hypothetical protein